MDQVNYVLKSSEKLVLILNKFHIPQSVMDGQTDKVKYRVALLLN